MCSPQLSARSPELIPSFTLLSMLLLTFIPSQYLKILFQEPHICYSLGKTAVFRHTLPVCHLTLMSCRNSLKEQKAQTSAAASGLREHTASEAKKPILTQKERRGQTLLWCSGLSPPYGHRSCHMGSDCTSILQRSLEEPVSCFLGHCQRQDTAQMDIVPSGHKELSGHGSFPNGMCSCSSCHSDLLPKSRSVP